MLGRIESKQEFDFLTNELWEYAVDTLHELSVTKLNWEH